MVEPLMVGPRRSEACMFSRVENHFPFSRVENSLSTGHQLLVVRRLRPTVGQHPCPLLQGERVLHGLQRGAGPQSTAGFADPSVHYPRRIRTPPAFQPRRLGCSLRCDDRGLCERSMEGALLGLIRSKFCVVLLDCGRFITQYHRDVLEFAVSVEIPHGE